MKQTQKNPYATNAATVRAPHSPDANPPRSSAIVGDDLRSGKKKVRKGGK